MPNDNRDFSTFHLIILAVMGLNILISGMLLTRGLLEGDIDKIFPHITIITLAWLVISMVYYPNVLDG